VSDDEFVAAFDQLVPVGDGSNFCKRGLFFAEHFMPERSTSHLSAGIDVPCGEHGTEEGAFAVKHLIDIAGYHDGDGDVTQRA
jgi:hypothetical protein